MTLIAAISDRFEILFALQGAASFDFEGWGVAHLFY